MNELLAVPHLDQAGVNARFDELVAHDRFDDVMAANDFMLDNNPNMMNPMDAFQGFGALNYDALKDHEEEVAEAVAEVNLNTETFSVDALHFAYELGLAQQARAAYEAEQTERAQRLQLEMLDKASEDKDQYHLAA